MSSLASALGVGAGILKPLGMLSVSANTITQNSVYYVYGNATLDTPSAYGVLLTIRAGNTNYGYWGIQVFFEINNATIYTRVGASGEDRWETWHKNGISE